MTSKNKDAIYGSSLTRQDLEPFIDKTKKIPFIYVYSCKVTGQLAFDDMVKILERGELPDFKTVIKIALEHENSESLAVMFARNQRSLEIKPYEGALLLQMSFGNKGKDWGSNYALWELTKNWCLENLEMTFIQDEMKHVDPIDMQLPK